ncbi:MAG: RT0821/Lpp0805 family surface protein [Pseudomonadota bacterium]
MRKLLALIILLMSLPTYAFNLSFLEYTPTYYFTHSDMDMMQATVNRALNSGRDNQRFNWNNPETTAFGHVTVSDTTRQDGTLCRRAKIFNSAKTVTGEASYRFCKINGEWKTA